MYLGKAHDSALELHFIYLFNKYTCMYWIF